MDRENKGHNRRSKCVHVWGRKRDEFNAEHVEDLPGNNLCGELKTAAQRVVPFQFHEISLSSSKTSSHKAEAQNTVTFFLRG